MTHKPDHRTLRRKLSLSQLLAVRNLYHNPTSTQPTITRLAQIYNVSYSTMWRALNTKGL